MSIYNNPVTRQTARMVSLVCGLLFTLFIAVYVLRMQGLLLATANHAFQGVSGFHPYFATLIVLAVLIIPPLIIQRPLRLPIRWKALVWIPSCIALGWFTDIHFPFEPEGGTKTPLWVFLLAFLCWCVVVSMVRNLRDSSETKGSLAQFITPNTIILIVGICFALATGNTNAILHQEIRQTYMLMAGDYEAVLHVGEKETRTSHTQQSLRAVALSRTGQLGNRLFYYPMTYCSEGLLPLPADTLRSLNLPKYVFKHLHGRPMKPLHTRGSFQTATGFLGALASSEKASEAAKEYYLCALLLDRRIDDFAETIQQFADTVSTALPRHYREALVLHNRLHSNPKVRFRDAETEENFSDFLADMDSHKGLSDERIYMSDYYKHTYWFYYYY